MIGIASRTSIVADIQTSVISATRLRRTRVFRSATVTLITGEKLEVILKDVSDSGARVEFLRDVVLPDRVLVSEPTLNLKRWAYVAWQTRGVAGLAFA